MRRSIVVAAAVAALASFGAPAAGAEAQTGPRASIWVEGDRDYFRHGDRMQVRFTSSYDAYVAVIHIDTDGTLDFLYPTSPWDDGYVRGGRVYSVPPGARSAWSVRSRPGIGYLYVIASEEPLDYRYFGGPYAGSWDWSFAGRSVRGDPYVALEQITRMLVPPHGAYTVDYYSYHVDRRHSYPSYACGSSGWGGSPGGWGWTPRYGSCDRLVIFLRDYPGYYDSRLYRGDRRVYLQGAELPEVRHGFKEPARGPARGRTLTETPRGAIGIVAPAPGQPAAEQPERRRPTLERRGVDPSTPAARPAGGSAQPAQPPSRRGGGGGEVRPTPRPASGGQGGGAVRPAARPAGGAGGGAARPAQPPRSRGSDGGQTEPAPARGGGGGTVPAETPRSRGGGGGDYLPVG